MNNKYTFINNILIFGMISLILLCCTDSNNISNNNIFDVVKILNSKTSTTALNDELDNLLFIKLELNEKCLISSIEKVIYCNKNLYIKSFDDLLVFDKNGGYIQKIGSIGNGPGEFNNITDFAINEKECKIAVCDLTGKKIIFYDLEGNFIQEKRMNFYPYKMIFLNNDLYIHPLNLTGSEKNSLLVFNSHLDSIYSYSNSIRFELDDYLMIDPQNTFQNIADKMVFHQLFNDTIFYFKTGKREMNVKYIFDFNKSKVPYSLLGSYDRYMKEISQYGYIEKIIEYQEYLFLDLFSKGDFSKFVINNNKSKSIYKVQENGIKLEKYGIYFWPISCQNNFLIDIINIPDICNENNKVFSLDTLKKYIGEVDEESNPIIIITQTNAEAEKQKE